MYQIKLSTSREFDYWIDYISKKVSSAIYEMGGVTAEADKTGRVSICIAVPSSQKSQAKELILSTMVECFVVNQKRKYFNRLLDLAFCDVVSRQMLINTLTAFNSTAERLYVSSKLRLVGDFNLDGFYNFKLRELRDQWKESVDMILSNSEIVRSEETFNVMLKFLLSGIDAKIKIVYVTKKDKNYFISSSDNNEQSECLSEGQLLVKLADIAPEKVVVNGMILNEKLRRKLSEIFCLKEKNCEKG